MRQCIERTAEFLSLSLLLSCGAPTPLPAPSTPGTPGTPVTEATVRAALSEGTELPERPRVEPEAGVLDLSRILLRDGHAEMLMRIDLSAVRELDLSETAITPTAIRGLCAAPGLDQIARLVIDCAGEAQEDLEPLTASAVALTECPTLHGLGELSILMCGIGDEAAEAIGRTPWTALEALVLPGNEIGPRGASAVAQSKALANLDRLRLEHNPLGEAGFAALVSSGLLGRADVDVAHCRLEDAAARALLTLDGVHRLDISGNPISDALIDELDERFGQGVETR